MQKCFLVLITLTISLCSFSQVGIGTNDVDTSAILEISSTEKGFLMPRLSATQMNTLSTQSPSEGLMVYCADCSPKGMYVYNGSFFKSTTEAISYELTAFPVANKIYKRDKITNTSTLNIAGTIHYNFGATSVLLETYRDNVLLTTLTQTLSGLDANHNYAFSFSPIVTAELANYKFVLKTNTGLLLEEVENIASGDIYIVQGQSNAVWSPFGNPNVLFPATDPYIRTFGNGVFTSALTTIQNSGIGGIGFAFAANIVSNENIPVMVLNGGDGGKQISFFQRLDGDKYNTSNNYGALLTRFSDAGYLASDVTAIIWYQGESDHTQTLNYYTNLFTDLYNDWEQDYTPDHYYVFQVHHACSLGATSFIPEAHRQLQDLFSKLTSISTNGALQGSDGCHYGDPNGDGFGYEVLAERLYNLLDFNYYNLGSDNGLYSPNISNVKFANAARTSISFNLLPATDAFSFNTAYKSIIMSNFSLVTTSVTDINLTGNTVTLTLSGAESSGSTLTYLGEKQAKDPYIFNQNTIGMFNFKVPIANF